MAQGLASICRVTWRARGTDPRRLWILEEIGCHLQEGVPCAAGAQRQGNILRKIRTKGNSGLWKKLAAGSRRLTHCTKVARHREHNHKRCDQDSVVQETQKGRTFGKRRWMDP
jgi:hypothetical protein